MGPSSHEYRDKLIFSATILLLLFCSNTNGQQSTRAADIRPEQIYLVFRNDSIIRNPDFEGDNWHTTWASDGHQYVLQCDGQGYNTQLWRLTGKPPRFKFEHVYTHPGPKEIPKERYYGFGILGVGPALYHYYSTPDKWYTTPPWNFIGTKLVHSPDNGKSWRNQDGSTPVVFEETAERNKNNMVFFNEEDNAFSLLTMLQMGKGYEQNSDGFVYVYAPNGGSEGKMNQLMLFRVEKNRIKERTAYRYYAGMDEKGTARWSARMEDRKPVYTFPAGHVNRLKHPYSWHPSVVYNAPLGMYMMANWGVGVDTSGMWFTKPTYLGFWLSKTPWGPWTQIHEDKAWFPPGGTKEGQCYQPQIMPGWIAPDGKSFWLAWTQYPKGYYFQTQRVDIQWHDAKNEKDRFTPAMIGVKGGSFDMGDQSGNGDADERPVHRMTVGDFRIGKTEVTVAQWREYTSANGLAMPDAPAWGWIDNHPIVNVTWKEANEYCKWLGKKTGIPFRLPTETEWEYAARGGSAGRNEYSGSATAESVAWYDRNSRGSTHAVATKKPNELGIYDMSGNAWEWCSDFFVDYGEYPGKNPRGLSDGIFVVRRGGSWDDAAQRTRVSYRMAATQVRSFHSLGFRVACDVK